MQELEKEIWVFLDRHLHSIFTRDIETYRHTTSEDLSLYEWFVSPHRQDGLDFHFFMIDNNWAGSNDEFRYDLLERRLQIYDNTAIATYTFMLSVAQDGAIIHRTHNESRVLIRTGESWKVVHVHKSPAWQSPHSPPQEGAQA